MKDEENELGRLRIRIIEVLRKWIGTDRSKAIINLIEEKMFLSCKTTWDYRQAQRNLGRINERKHTPGDNLVERRNTLQAPKQKELVA